MDIGWVVFSWDRSDSNGAAEPVADGKVAAGGAERLCSAGGDIFMFRDDVGTAFGGTPENFSDGSLRGLFCQAECCKSSENEHIEFFDCGSFSWEAYSVCDYSKCDFDFCICDCRAVQPGARSCFCRGGIL